MDEGERSDAAKERTGDRAVRTAWICLTIAVSIVALVVVWQAALYTGLFATVAEWQFQYFGQWLPAFSFLVFLAIPALIVGPIVWLLRHRKEAAGQTGDSFAQWLATAETFRKAMNWIALGLAVIATAVCVTGFLTAQSGSPARLAGGQASAAGHRDVVIVPGVVDASQGATLALDLLYFSREMKFAPIIDPARPNTIRYFAEVPGHAGWREDTAGETVMFDGQVPGPIRTLFQRLGYNVATDAKLLNGSQVTVLWPYFIGAVQLILAAMFALGIGRLQQHRITRARDRAALDEEESRRFPTR